MLWMILSLCSAAIGAVTGILDKTVMYRYAVSPYTLPILIGLCQTFVGIVILLSTQIPAQATIANTSWAVISGFLFGVSGVLLIRVMFNEEVSRAMPIYNSAPIFAGILAAVFLGETLTPTQWIGIGLSVLGAGALSIKSLDGWKQAYQVRRSLLLILAAFFYGVGMIVAKIAVDELPILYTHGLRVLSLGTLFLVTNFRGSGFREIRGFFQTRNPAIAFVSLNEFLVATVGLLLALWALALGPVSLVTGLLGTRALFVIVYSTLLAAIQKGALGESITPSTVGIKLGAGGAIVAGIFAMTL